jgi:hypothetical protein
MVRIRGSVSLTYRTNPVPDPTLFVSGFQNANAITLHLFVLYSLRTVDKFYHSVFTYCVPLFKTGGPFSFLFKI